MMQKNQTINIGIIGAGKMGELHAKNLLYIKKARVVAIADINATKAENLAKNVGAKKVYSSYDLLLKDEEIKAVIISLPNNLHYDAVIKAIEANKDIFCEKPLTLSSKDAEDILRKARIYKVKLQVGFNRRFDPSYEKAKRFIEEGLLGKILIAYSNTYDPEPHSGWEGNEEISGGIFFTTCSHDFDLLRWLIGEEVEKIYVEINGTFGKNQYASCLLTFNKGIIATVNVMETCPYGHDVKTEIVGDKGALRIEKPSMTFLSFMNKDGIHKDYPYWFINRFEVSYIREIEDFISSIFEDRDPKVNVIDGIKAVKICEAAIRSMIEGRPVKIE